MVYEERVVEEVQQHQLDSQNVECSSYGLSTQGFGDVKFDAKMDERVVNDKIVEGNDGTVVSKHLEIGVDLAGNVEQVSNGGFEVALDNTIEEKNVECDSIANGKEFESVPENVGHGVQGSELDGNKEGESTGFGVNDSNVELERVERGPAIIAQGVVQESVQTVNEDVLDNAKEEQNTESNVNVVVSSNAMECARVEGTSRSLASVEEVKDKDKDKAHDARDVVIELAGGPVCDEVTGEVRVIVLGSPAAGCTTGEISRRGRKPGKRTSATPTTDKKYPLRSPEGRARSSRSRLYENGEGSQPSNEVGNVSGKTGGRRGRKKKTEVDGKSHDEFSKMRKHLRYLLHRIHYAQNLLDAYASEGWRGQSLEKLRPEKELQRAKDDISRSKLKIRDLFQRLDSMSAEGKFPETLYDSEGLIDSEDIFCAKCGSKDLYKDNDIILCDGACERGFHQYCLDPPLRTEDIPPGDEGWLCPACDCKVDCTDLLNDTQGTKLSIEDSWEKVFPETAAAMSGNDLDAIMALPSDDSEDNDYNPEGADDDEGADNDAKAEGSESSSDEYDTAESGSSECSSVSEDLGAKHADEQYLGLPSDDSEDDNYDPDAANVDDDMEGSSNSDFTSASEDLGAAVGNDETSDNDEPPLPSLEPDQDGDDSPPVSRRRHVEKLDYKKLYDETYGNADSDSSDDGEWTETESPEQKKGGAIKGVSDSPNGVASAPAGGTSNAGAPRRRGRKKLHPQEANDSPAPPSKSSQKTSSSGKGTKRPPYNKLGEAVTQRLYESFQENRYPDRQTKEKLALELGLTPQRVDKWFGNARWSFTHHPARAEASMAAATSPSNTPHKVACNGIESVSATTAAAPEHTSADGSKSNTVESGGRKSSPKQSRKRKNTEDGQPILESLNTETLKEGTSDTLQTPEAQKGRGRGRRKKSGA